MASSIIRPCSARPYFANSFATSQTDGFSVLWTAVRAEQGLGFVSLFRTVQHLQPKSLLTWGPNSPAGRALSTAWNGLREVVHDNPRDFWESA